jgi:hypothetical protein
MKPPVFQESRRQDPCPETSFCEGQIRHDCVNPIIVGVPIMKNDVAISTQFTPVDGQNVEELSEQEIKQVQGAGLLSSPLGIRDTARGAWVREVVEDVEAY